MADSLPHGHEFVDETDIGTEELWQLIDDVAGANVPLIEGVIQYGTEEEVVELSTEEDDVQKTAIGVRDSFDKLVAYASATIDHGHRHATVDFIAVHPHVREETVAKALSDEGMRFLGRMGVKSASFMPFGQIELLLPYLIRNYGFEYNLHNSEYFTKDVSAAPPKTEIKTDVDAAIAEMAKNEPTGRRLKSKEMAAFRDRVSDLVKECARYACANALDIEDYDHFNFELAGQVYMVGQNIVPELGYNGWSVIECDVAELVTSQHGIVMVTERMYKVTQNTGTDLPQNAAYSDEREIRGTDGKMRPLHLHKLDDELRQKLKFTLPRYERIMTALNRLTPDHLAS